MRSKFQYRVPATGLLTSRWKLLIPSWILATIIVSYVALELVSTTVGFLFPITVANQEMDVGTDDLESDMGATVNISDVIRSCRDSDRFPIRGIPNFIHQSYKTKHVGQKWKHYSDTWRQLNPKWQYVFWTDASNDVILNSLYPEYSDVYYKVYSGIMRADFARLMYMDLCGGIYIDMDFIGLRPLDTYPMTKYGNIAIIGAMGTNMAFEHSLPNALLMSTKGHSLWRHCMDLAAKRAKPFLKSNKPDKAKGLSVEKMTGPVFLRDCVLDFTGHGVIRPAENIIKTGIRQALKTYFGKRAGQEQRYTPRTGFQTTGRKQADIYIARWLDFYPICWKAAYRSPTELYLWSLCRPCQGKRCWRKAMGRCREVYQEAGSYALTFWDHSWD